MITSVTIENFKRFKHLEIPDLSRITLLGGRNNVGKTSVLSVISSRSWQNNHG
jgi:AAA15 family ATPase/GTPase